MVIVSDTTAISNLLKLGKINYLKEVFHQLVIPGEVFNELLPLKDLGYNLGRLKTQIGFQLPP